MYLFLGISKKYFCIALLSIVFVIQSQRLPNAYSTELTFTDSTVEAGLSYPLSPSFGLSWGDFDQDGLIDLYVKNHNVNSPSFYQNSGDGVFEDITVQAGLRIDDDFHGACWGDFDNDGDLDLYQAVGACGGHGIKANYFFQNNNSGFFTDIAASVGIQDPLGRGRTPIWFDYNNDGKLDLFIANVMRDDAPSILYRNNGDETFTDVTEDAGLAGIERAVGAYVADVNGDGFVELLLSSLAGVSLYANNGDGIFTNMTSEAGLSGITMVHDLALGDYDKDGDMDVFVARGPCEGSDTYVTDSDKLYYRLTLKDLEKGFKVNINGSSTAEFDLYVYEKKVPTESIFIGSEKYTPVSIPFLLDAGSPENYGEPIHTDSGIYIWFELSDNNWHIIYHPVVDRRPMFGGTISTPGSIFQVTPVDLEIDPTSYTNQLFENAGNGRFFEVTDSAGLGLDTGSARSAVFADFDNDSDLDLYVVYTGGVFNMPNKLYENNGAGYFVDIAATAGAQAEVEGRGESVAVADYNNDGFMDMLILNGLGNAPFHLGTRALLENQKTGNNWIQINLTGRISNHDGVGSIISLAAGALNLTRQQTGGMHCFSQNSQVLQFGLGDETMVDKITVRWPSGIVQQLSNIDVNQRLVVEEPSVSLTLFADTLTVPQGGVLGVQATATNYTNEDQSFIFASNVTLPNGSINPFPPDFLFGPQWVTLAPYETKHRHITHDIPINAPLDAYIYNGYIGKGLQNIWNEDHVEFTVTP